MANPDRKLDDWTDAARTARGADDPVTFVEAAGDERLLALHAALREPPHDPAAPDLAPVVMARIARRSTAARTTAARTTAIANGGTSGHGGALAWLRDALAHIALGPVAAVGSLAAVLAVALWSAGDDGAGVGLSGAAAGVAVPSLAVVALVAVAVGLGALWLRRR